MNKRILVVEDDQTLSDAFTIVLQKEGYDVDTAFDGKEALERVRSVTYDLILLDLLMPVLDGKGFLEKFKNPANTPVIVFSNLDAKDDIDEALRLGASRYMLKAWASPNKLAELVKETIH